MHLSPDQIVLWQYGFVKINATIVYMWIVMLVMAVGSKLITARLAGKESRSRWQNMLEIIVIAQRNQIEEIGIPHPNRYIVFLGTLFLFIALSSLLSIIPGYEAPTGSLSTTAALAICVFIAVPLFGIRDRGILGYLKTYMEPSFVMLPFHIITEVTRTFALAVRLFGNVMSGAMIIGILLSITPFVFPIVMSLLELLTGVVQAYIFSILAAVYMAAAVRSQSAEINNEVISENHTG